MPSRVFRTIRSSGPCNTSVLPGALALPLATTKEYRNDLWDVNVEPLWRCATMSGLSVNERQPSGGGIRWLEILVQDLRFAVRTLRKAPTATATPVLTLALGVGLNTAIFSVVKSVLLNQLPFRDPTRIVALAQTNSTNTHGDGVE